MKSSPAVCASRVESRRISSNPNLTVLPITPTMSDPSDSDLLAISIDADNSTETSTNNTPPISRTFQSEADFQSIKSTYTAKIDGPGTAYKDLIKAVPALDTENTANTTNTDALTIPTLNKKHIQVLGYAVGELYYSKRYREIIDLCQRVRRRCDAVGRYKPLKSLSPG